MGQPGERRRDVRAGRNRSGGQRRRTALAVLDVDGDADLDIVDRQRRRQQSLLIAQRRQRRLRARADVLRQRAQRRVRARRRRHERRRHHRPRGRRRRRPGSSRPARNGHTGPSPLRDPSAGRAARGWWPSATSTATGTSTSPRRTAARATAAILLGNGRRDASGRRRSSRCGNASSRPTSATSTATATSTGSSRASASASGRSSPTTAPGTSRSIRRSTRRRTPSCSVLIDFDNDGDLDMALIDEVADVVMLEQNRKRPRRAAGRRAGKSVRPARGAAHRQGRGTTLELTWSPSCRVTDTDYAVYAGPIGSFDDHDVGDVHDGRPDGGVDGARTGKPATTSWSRSTRGSRARTEPALPAQSVRPARPPAIRR